MNHLDEQQFAELLSASRRELSEGATGPELAQLQAHACECSECAAELASMRDSLALFREASTAYADAHLNRLPAWRPPARRASMLQSAYWAAAAAAVFLATFVPLQMANRHPVQPPIQVPVVVAPQQAPAETDEALLEDVNRELSESVPSPMAALADPTGTSTNASQNSTQRTN
ncbi:MAG TPA: hypothetical protein VHU44_17195 [Acidobacteriaceae bacterium]|jgi:hypothetical protein|nr:hypothetical protein [Acidobacteriaceae bacterium]